MSLRKGVTSQSNGVVREKGNKKYKHIKAHCEASYKEIDRDHDRKTN